MVHDHVMKLDAKQNRKKAKQNGSNVIIENQVQKKDYSEISGNQIDLDRKKPQI